VVLNCGLRCGEVVEGTSPFDLLALYRSSELPVVALNGLEAAELLRDDEEVIFIERDPDGGVVGAVQRLTGR
jgi:hypothetical protein